MAKRDYYDVLGVSRSASADEIRRAHRKLVMKFHPDRNKGDARADEKFKEVQEAYDVLSDPQKRAAYDRFGHAGVGAAGGPPPGAPDPFEAFRRATGGTGFRGQRWQAGPNVSVEDFDFDFGPGGGGGGGGFADLFEQLFGAAGARRGGGAGAGSAGARARGRTAAAEPPRGADAEHAVTLTFEQAARGTTLPLQINRDGRLETIDVKIPPGVKDGSRIRIRGKGHQVERGVAGDLYIVTRVAPHRYFRREDQDVYLELPISLWEALLGAKVEVPTLDGPVTLTIPPGASSGAKLRIPGRGIEKAGQRGHQYVVLRVIVPRNLDDDDRKAVEQMARKHPVHARADVPW